MYRRAHLKMLLFLNYEEATLLLERLKYMYDNNTWNKLYVDYRIARWNVILKKIKKAGKQGGKENV